VDGALSYVTSRALEGTTLFKDARDYEAYLGFLKDYQERFGFKLFAFVLLPDQLHLCLEPAAGVTISSIMHALNSRYTKYFTKRYCHSGHVFQERFKLTLLEKAPSLLWVTGYLHTHPRRSGVATDLQGYRWSSYPSYLVPGTARPGPRLGGEVAEVLERLSLERPGWTYELYLHSMPETEWESVGQELERPVVGSEPFRTLVEEAKRRAAAAPAAVPAETVSAEIGAVSEEPSAGPRPELSPILTGSLAVAFIALCAAALYARNLITLKQTVQTLAQERRLLVGGVPAVDSASAHLASFSSPLKLNGVSVEIGIQAITGTSYADSLEFKGGKMTSRVLEAKGFFPSHYTVTSRGGTIIWEAVQTDRTGALMAWKGEWDGQVMRGVLTQEAAGKTPVSFSFVGATQPSPKQPTSET
jgi:REP element-mobilizing transposase RayT